MTIHRHLDIETARARERRRRANAAKVLLTSGREFTIGDLAAILQVDTGTARRLVDKFKVAGWVEMAAASTRGFPTIYRGTAPQRHGEARETGKSVSGTPAPTEAESATSGPQEGAQ